MTNVLIDFDSVLFDLAVSQVASYNAKHGTSHQKDDIKHWGWWAEQDHPEFVWGDDCFNNREWTMATPAVHNASRGMQTLYVNDIRAYVVTQRHRYMRPWVIDWLHRNSIIYTDVITTDEQYGKLDAIHDYRLKAALDDAPHNVQLLSMHIPTFLFDQPWNRGFDEHAHGAERVVGWTSAAQRLVDACRGGTETHNKGLGYDPRTYDGLVLRHPADVPNGAVRNEAADPRIGDVYTPTVCTPGVVNLGAIGAGCVGCEG